MPVEYKEKGRRRRPFSLYSTIHGDVLGLSSCSQDEE